MTIEMAQAQEPGVVQSFSVPTDAIQHDTEVLMAKAYLGLIR